MTTERCGRETVTGSGTHVTCELRVGHRGAHRGTWVDRDGRHQTLLTWTHEDWRQHAVWPETAGARDVRNDA